MNIMNIAQIKKTINSTNNIDLLNSISFASTLMSISLPDELVDEQQQRSILADTIYYTIQCRLDQISNCNKLYSLGKLYFALKIPKAFLKV